MYDVIGSIVLFKNKGSVVKKTVESFLATSLKVNLYIIDNSPTDYLRDMCVGENVEYIFNNRNLGFGAGHNIALGKSAGKTKYNLILNPDIYFEKGTLERIFNFMNSNKNVGSLLPKVLYPDNSLQYLCRLIPNPYDVFIRKLDIRILHPFIRNRKLRNEFRFTDYNRIMNVPYLSGCFMFIKSEVFEKIGIFDERFFLYFEDVDLARRINEYYQTLYYPEAVIYHAYAKGSAKSLRLFMQMILSGIKYFNKWGWFLDHKRSIANTKAINELRYK
ncbi:MAG: glycosyltransferase family 2 protein [Candidatus Omnitrophica bacterium]|nr:glycosyltransferase family 2 protein [Candidatus Omnitrophota bacterium]